MALVTPDLITINVSTASASTTTSDYLENEDYTTLFSNIQTDDEVSLLPTTSSPDGRLWNNVGWKGFNFATGEREFEVPFLLAVVLCGVLGNALVLVVYLQKKYRKYTVSLYIINLAVGDLFILLIVVVFHITEFFPQTWPYLWRSHTQCWLHRFARFLGFNCTIFTSLVIAVDRFLAVVKPLQFKAECTAKRTLRNIFIVWVVALLAAVPCAWNFRAKFKEHGYYENYHGKSPFACWVLDLGKVFNDFKIVYMSILLFFVPVAITMVFYILIVTFIWRNNREMKAMTALGKARRTHWKTSRMLMLVFIAYFACYIMFSTYTIVQQIFLYSVKPIVKNVGLLMPYANSCLNPIMYLVINKQFRQAVAETFYRHQSKTSSSKDSDTAKSGNDASKSRLNHECQVDGTANAPKKTTKIKTALTVSTSALSNTSRITDDSDPDSGLSSRTPSVRGNDDDLPMEYAASAEAAIVPEIIEPDAGDKVNAGFSHAPFDDCNCMPVPEAGSKEDTNGAGAYGESNFQDAQRKVTEELFQETRKFCDDNIAV